MLKCHKDEKRPFSSDWFLIYNSILGSGINIHVKIKLSSGAKITIFPSATAEIWFHISRQIFQRLISSWRHILITSIFESFLSWQNKRNIMYTPFKVVFYEMFRANHESSLRIEIYLMPSHESYPFVACTLAFRTKFHLQDWEYCCIFERHTGGLAFSLGVRTNDNKLQVYKLSTMKISHVGFSSWEYDVISVN